MAVKNLYESAITGVTGDNNIVIDSVIDFNDDNETDFVTFFVLSNYEVSIGDEINYYDYTNTLLFAGVVREINNNNPKEILVFKFDILLSDRIVNETLENYTVEGLIEYIVNTYSSLTFSSTFVSGITIPRYPAKDIRALEIIRDAISLVPSLTYNVTNLKVFELYLKGSQSSGITLINGTNCAVLGGWNEDTSKQVTRLILYGEQQVSKDTIDLFNGDGSNDTFTLSEIPNNILVEVDTGSGFVKQELKVEGQTTGDFVLNKETKKIIFQSGSIPAVGSNNIRITYDFSINIRVEFDADKTIQDTYGIIEKKVTKSYLNTDDSAFDYASQYIDKFQEPLINARIQKLDSISLTNLRIGYSINCIDNINTINNNNINENLIIRKIKRRFIEGSLIISVGEVGADTIDILGETKYNVRQLYDKDNNSSITTKSQLLTNKTLIKVKTELEQLQRTLPDNYLYLFNEIEGLQLWIKGDSEVLDYSGNSNTISWNGSENYLEGKQFDYIISLNGSNYISVNETLNNIKSISLQIKPNSNNTELIQLTATDSVSINSSNEITTIGLTNVIIEVDNILTNDITLDTFQLVTISFDSINCDDIVIGDGYDGLIGDIRFYNETLNDNAKTSLYNDDLGLTSNCNIAEVGNGEDRVICDIISGLDGWWKLNDDVLDYSDNNNTAELVLYEGEEIIAIDTNYNLNFNNTFTLCFWFKKEEEWSDEYSFWDTFDKITDGKILFGSFTNGGLIVAYDSTSNITTDEFNINEWNHIIFEHNAWNGTNHNYSLLVNNVLISSQNSTTQKDFSGDLIIGKLEDWFYNHTVQDLRIYDKSLSSNEKSSIYNEGLGSFDNCINELSDGTLGTKYVLVNGNVWNNIPYNELSSQTNFYDLSSNSLDIISSNDGTDVNITYDGEYAIFNGNSTITISSITPVSFNLYAIPTNNNPCNILGDLLQIKYGKWVCNEIEIADVIIGEEQRVSGSYDGTNWELYINGIPKIKEISTLISFDTIGENYEGRIKQIRFYDDKISINEVNNLSPDEYGSWENIE